MKHLIFLLLPFTISSQRFESTRIQESIFVNGKERKSIHPFKSTWNILPDHIELTVHKGPERGEHREIKIHYTIISKSGQDYKCKPPYGNPITIKVKPDRIIFIHSTFTMTYL